MSLAYRVSGYNRKRKWALFNDVIRPTPDTTVLDVGFSDREYSDTDNFLEKHYQWQANITALGVDTPVEFPQRYPAVKVVQYDGTRFPFDDNAFDVVWSNAVIEHVGTSAQRHAAMLLFLRECARVGRAGFITTPNKWFPIEVHTRTPLLHWLPKPVFDRYLRLRKQDWATGDYMDLLSRRQFQRLLREAGITNYRLHDNRIAGLTMDFVAVWDNR